MFLSVIVCTYRRATALTALLGCLTEQSYRDFEVLIVDGSGDDTAVSQVVAQFRAEQGQHLNLRYVPTPRGLCHQRNVGLREARGEVLCFFDDDVTFESDFLGQVVAILSLPELHEAGAITGYDVLHYGRPVGRRYRVRRWLGLYPSLTPGRLGRCTLPVPLGFQPPFSGCRPVEWIPGFCMIYRRDAVTGLQFDEGLPAIYGGEDSDFSSQVGERRRLWFCGDLPLRHHSSPVQRLDAARRVYASYYGLARRQLRRSRTLAAGLALVWLAGVELVLDSLATLGDWTRLGLRLRLLLAKQAGLLDGARSLR